MIFSEKPIGFFDSGVGGLSVLKEAVKLLPKENFIYYGDSKNAPYGVKTLQEVRNLTFLAVEHIIDMDVKAVVVACNTATSAAIDGLRDKYPQMIMIGIEPALKPAVELNRKGNILIMATPMTLCEKKFKELVKHYSKGSNIIPVPCAGLVELIEGGITSGQEVNTYLRNKLENYLHEDISAVVLGCTHYPFIKEELKKVLPQGIPILDGSKGTVTNLKRQMEVRGILNVENKKGKVEITNSSDKKEIIELSNKLLRV